MLVIDPDVCIDCGICESECPIGAIAPDTHPEGRRWLGLNRQYAKQWPRIVKKGIVPQDASLWENVEDKYNKFFSENTHSTLE